MPSPLIVTLGDPNGLGPELVARLARDPSFPLPETPLLLLGPESALALQGEPFWRRLRSLDTLADLQPGWHLFVPPGLEGFVPEPGRAAVEGGRAAGLTLDLACDLLLDGRARGLATCPLNKAMLQQAGFDFPGHTEFLARRAGLDQDEVCMHLCGDILRVSLVTTHPPLREVADLITRERVLRSLLLTGALAQDLGWKGPIAVCGLNPHAGEWGAIGREEIEVIEPAVDQARLLGLDVAGPLPADTVFHRAAKGDFAAVLAMYHDQGLGPLKLMHFGRAVNVTLGLPFVRTSVDHGTGYDLVGAGTADTGSLKAALDLAARLLHTRSLGHDSV